MKTDEDHHHRVQPLTLKLKRSASGIQRLSASASSSSNLTPPLHIKPSSTSTFPTTSAILANAAATATSNNHSPSSVQAARKNVQSTAELVAQISEQLQHYGTIFDTSTLNCNNNNNGKDLVNKQQQLQINLQKDVISMSSMSTTNNVQFINKNESSSIKKKRTKLSTEPIHNHLIQEPNYLNGRQRQLDDAVNNHIKKESKKKRGRPKMTENNNNDTGIYQNNNYLNNIAAEVGGHNNVERLNNSLNSLTKSSGITPKFNWFEKYPIPNLTTENDEFIVIDDNSSISSSTLSTSQIPTKIIEHPCNSYAFSLNNDGRNLNEEEKRKILILPYIDIGEPDWIVHGLPEKERYLFPDIDSVSSSSTFQTLKQNFKK